MGRQFVMRRPPPISDRPVVRVVHPSGQLKPHAAALERGLSHLEGLGCQVRWDARRLNDCDRGYFAGNDEIRRAELCAALEEPDVEIIWCARGGSGMNRIIGPVLEHARHLPPRCLIGFSDITTMLNAFSLHLEWVTFHGPVVTTLGRPDPATDLDRILATLQGQETDVWFPAHPGTRVSGQLLGGNLTVLASMVGDQLRSAPKAGSIWLWRMSAKHHTTGPCSDSIAQRWGPR